MTKIPTFKDFLFEALEDIDKDTEKFFKEMEPLLDKAIKRHEVKFEGITNEFKIKIGTFDIGDRMKLTIDTDKGAIVSTVELIGKGKPKTRAFIKEDVKDFSKLIIDFLEESI